MYSKKNSRNEMKPLSPLFSQSQQTKLTKKQKRVERIVSAFKDYSEKHRLHLHRRGATPAGWNAWTVSVWKRHCRELLKELEGDSKRLETVLQYYMRHAAKDKYVKHCATFITFHTHFHNIERWYQRREGVDSQPKQEWEVEVVS